MVMRNLGRIGVVGVLVAGALGVAAPALAADVDFGLGLTGTTIAADASGKWPQIEFTNLGTTKPASVVVLFDTTKLDASKVGVGDVGQGCKTESGVTSCALDDHEIPGPGGREHLLIPLKKVAGATGAAGKLTVTVKAEGDTVEGNNSRTVDVAVGDHGADISVFAADVVWQDAHGTFTGDPVPPGETAPLMPLVVNQGDMTAVGVRLHVTLPTQATFTDRLYNGCVLSPDRRTADCELTQFSLVPQDKDPDGGGSGMFFTFMVHVSPDAKGPVALKGGSVTATAIDQVPFTPAQRGSAARLPDFASRPTAAELAKVDADLTDNTDNFVVFVGAAPGGGGGGGGLPVTGPAALTIGGGGLAAVVAGLVLLVVSRRRRVIAVAPPDER